MATIITTTIEVTATMMRPFVSIFSFFTCTNVQVYLQLKRLKVQLLQVLHGTIPPCITLATMMATLRNRGAFL